MATITEKTTEDHAGAEGLPPLASGDRLTRVEFEQRYAAMPGVRAELVEGVVYMQAAIRHSQHGQPHSLLSGWLFTYYSDTPGTDVGDASSLRLDPDNEPQPDLLMRIESECGGRSHIDAEGFLTGAPELVAEISASSASYDLHDKLNAYRRNGIQEYIVWRVLDREIDWFVLREGRYEKLQADEKGVLKSEVYPGLWLKPASLLERDISAVISCLKEGTSTDSHAEFCRELAGKRG